MQELRRACENIWESYKIYTQGAAVIRSGFELTGVSSCNSAVSRELGETFRYRGESILEHQAKVAWLASAFLWVDNKGENIFGQDERDFRAYAGMLPKLIIALCHDVGEYRTGDIPDDGRAEHANKDEQELAVFTEMAVAYGLFGHHLRVEFWHFQNKDNCGGQALYALDKLEAVLTLINLERCGIVGSIKLKPTPTDSDYYYMRMTGSDNPVDCWAAHMRAQIGGFHETVVRPVLTLLDVAINDVRGKSFDWWNKKIPPYQPN